MDAKLDRLYAEILANPDDDTPRILYAEVAGGERAELIRQGIALRDLRRKGLHGGYVVPTEQKVATLVRRHPEWAAEVLPLVASVEFGRGFVERVTLPAVAFLERAEKLYARAPIRHAQLTQASGHVEALAASPLLSRLRSLDLSMNQLQDRDAIALAESPHLTRLRWLDLSKNYVGEAGLEALAAATPRHLPDLRYLGFLLNRCQDPSEQRVDDENGNSSFADRPEGEALEAKYGSLAWLHHRAETLPDPDYVS